MRTPTGIGIAFTFDGGGELRIRDPRRLGGVLLDPDEERLGPDALDLTAAQLRDLAATSKAPIKARLMNQEVVSGIGNLLVDEALWRAGIDPAAVALTDPERDPPPPQAPPPHPRRPRRAWRLTHG